MDLIIYDHLEEMLFRERMKKYFNERCEYYARDLMSALDYKDFDEFEKIINIAERACMSLQIPVSENFQEVYCYTNEGLMKDWKLSRLAVYLIAINGDPSHPAVALAQLFFAIRK